MRSNKTKGRARNKKRPQPSVYIIAGPNGAGKSTFAREFLPSYVKCLEFVNADYLAEGLAPFAPERAAIRAGRIMLTRIRELAKQKTSFGFETTLAGKSYVKLINTLKTLGFAVHLYFLWLPNASLALQRVAQRVRKGGHDIPRQVVKRRFRAGLRNFFSAYAALADSWIIWDASLNPPKRIAESSSGRDLTVYNHVAYNKIIAKRSGK